MVRWVIRSIPHGGPTELFLVLHDWFNNGCGMSYPVCSVVYIIEPLMLIEKSSSCSLDLYYPVLKCYQSNN